jgi:hypothetical protein
MKDDDDEQVESDLQAEKVKLKSRFDAEFDQSKDPDSTYLNELQQEVELQSKVLLSFSLSLVPSLYRSVLVESIGIREHAR